MFLGWRVGGEVDANGRCDVEESEHTLGGGEDVWQKGAPPKYDGRTAPPTA